MLSAGQERKRDGKGGGPGEWVSHEHDCGCKSCGQAAAAQPQGTPGRCRLSKVHPSSGQMPLALLSPTAQDRSHTCGCMSLTSPRSGSLLDGVEWVRWQRKHKLVSSDFSLQRQPPPASCRDGPGSACSLQLETEGSRWPCLAQIPARLPGRCGRSDGAGARRRNTRGEGGSHLFTISVGSRLYGWVWWGHWLWPYLWSLNRQMLRAPWREMVLVF